MKTNSSFKEGSSDVREIEQPRTEEEGQEEQASRLSLEAFGNILTILSFLPFTPLIYIMKTKLSREILKDQELKVRSRLQLEIMSSLQPLV